MLEIRQLNGSHSGDWSCLVQGETGNHTRTVSIYVIAHDTKYCPMNGMFIAEMLICQDTITCMILTGMNEDELIVAKCQLENFYYYSTVVLQLQLQTLYGQQA